VAPPQGHARIAGDGYAISAFSKQDPDTLFRIIATSASQANMRGAASLLIPPRTSLLDDPGLRQANRFYPAALASYETGLAAPALPEFHAVGEFITRRILQAVTGEMPVKQALDTAAEETTAFLKGHGYYKGNSAPSPRRLLRTGRKLVAVPGAERSRTRRGHAVSAGLCDLSQPVQL
jgi:multiple sugar transport system substrate-binding protein